MNDNGLKRNPKIMFGYVYQNDLLALKQTFNLPDINYADISQREHLNAAIKRWPLLAELIEHK